MTFINKNLEVTGVVAQEEPVENHKEPPVNKEVEIITPKEEPQSETEEENKPIEEVNHFFSDLIIGTKIFIGNKLITVFFVCNFRKWNRKNK